MLGQNDYILVRQLASRRVDLFCGGHDSLALFAVDADSGRLSRADVVEIGGSGHREFNIEPSGKFLFSCNTQSNDVISFAIDGETGRMTRAAKTSVQRAAVIDFAVL